MSCVNCHELIAYRCEGCNNFYCQKCRWDLGHQSTQLCGKCDKIVCQENFSYQYKTPFDKDGKLRTHTWCNTCVRKSLSDYNNNPKKQRMEISRF